MSCSTGHPQGPADPDDHLTRGHLRLPRPVGGLRRWRLVVVAALVGALAPVAIAHAQSVDDLRSQAQAITQEVEELREHIEALSDDYNRSTARVETATATLARSNAELEANQAELERRRNQLADYAVQAYVKGGDLPSLDGFLSGAPDTSGRRLSYLRTAAGDRQALIDSLHAARQDVQRRAAKVEADRVAAEAEAARVDDARAEATIAKARLDELLGQVNGRLAEAVAEEEARRAAEEARLAEEARQAAAAAQAAAQTAASQTSRSTAAVAQAAAPATSSESRTTTPPRAATSAGTRAAAQVAVDAALSVLGVPYVWAGASPSEGFDCSGLMQWAWARAGRSLSHAADWQRDETQPISESELEPGDLIFYGEPPSHVAMYAGGGQIINAPYTGQVVRLQSMYYSSKSMSYGRVN